MGNLNLTKKIDNSQLAYELFNFDTEGQYSREVKKILKEFTRKGEEYPDRQDIFLKAIDLIGEPQTEKEKYIVAEAYLWSRAPFKLKGIEYGKKYLESELWKERYVYCNLPNNVENTLSNKKNVERAHFLHEIGIIYESQYMFKEALECYEKEIECIPFFQFGYIDKSKVLVKLDKKEEALDLLLFFRRSKYCKDDCKDIIEDNITEIEKKIKKNYKYRPRPSDCKIEKEEYDQLSTLQKRYLEEYIKRGLVIIEK